MSKLSLLDLIKFELYRACVSSSNDEQDSFDFSKEAIVEADQDSDQVGLLLRREPAESDDELLQRRLVAKIRAFPEHLPEKNVARTIQFSIRIGAAVVFLSLFFLFAYLVFGHGALLRVVNDELLVGNFLTMASIQLFLLSWMTLSMLWLLIGWIARRLHSRSVGQIVEVPKNSPSTSRAWMKHGLECLFTFPVRMIVTVIYLVASLVALSNKDSQLASRQLLTFSGMFGRRLTRIAKACFEWPRS